jgi:acetyl-CoA C-acetyltransferase
MAIGIKDKVAILGMGCSKFGERWDATHMDDVGTGRGGTPMAIALRLPNIGVTRVENFCAGGSEAIRAAVYAVAAGACDIAIAMGVEKLKDTGYGGLPVSAVGTYIPQWYPNAVAPANFAQLASAYQRKHNVDPALLKRAIARVSVKSHANGARNPKAHFRQAVTEEQVLKAPIIAEPLGLFDCAGVSDGAAAVIVTRPDIARSLGKRDLVTFKALQVAVSNGWEMHSNEWDGSYVHTARIAARKAYAEAGIRNPAEEVSMTEVHDCFSITELVTMEDLGLSAEGAAVRDVLDGKFDADGAIPCQIDGGLKCFGHPIGASGIRMLYEMYLQLQGRAGPRQLKDPKIGLTHNLGGQPSQNVCSVSIVGREGASA